MSAVWLGEHLPRETELKLALTVAFMVVAITIALLLERRKK